MSFIAHIGNTIFCMYQQKYNKQWDKKLNSLLDQYADTAIVNEYTIKLGDWDVWIANKWYAYGNAYLKSGCYIEKHFHFRPSIFTMMRLNQTVQNIKKIRKEEKKAVIKEKAKELFKIA